MSRDLTVTFASYPRNGFYRKDNAIVVFHLQNTATERKKTPSYVIYHCHIPYHISHIDDSLCRYCGLTVQYLYTIFHSLCSVDFFIYS